MAFNDIELYKIKQELEAFLEVKRPRADRRDQLDIGYQIDDQSITIIEIRARYDDPTQKSITPIAKATYVGTEKVWKVYWMRGTLKWCLYQPKSKVKEFKAFLDLVAKDKLCCFFG